jgi:hypothetical protein
MEVMAIFYSKEATASGQVKFPNGGDLDNTVGHSSFHLVFLLY